MLLTRWKLMAGVLGVSIGGLAAAASQCPKLDKTKGRQPEAPVTAEAPKLPPAGAPSAPVLPPAPPAVPQLVPAGVTPPLPSGPVTDLKLPDAPTGGLTLPELPVASPEPKPAKPVKPAEVQPTSGLLPPLPDAKPVAEAPAKKPTPPMAPPKPAALPTTPAAEAPTIVPIGDLVPPAPAKPTPPPAAPAPTGDVTPALIKPAATMPTPVVPTAGTTQLPPAPPAESKNPLALPIEQPNVIDVPASKPAPAEAVKAASKYRIVLRVGEGEPTFEVRSGDDLILKVACEKVDVKSPEKGAGLSAVTARGKVRFAGFGVEGTCEELAFMAGTGEVSMNGDVKVQMKDKLGRVESELTTATLKYKVDASVVGGSIKP